jgi:hypothetical protein
MAKTYMAPRKLSVPGRAGKKPIKAIYGDPETDLIIHMIREKRKLEKERQSDRWRLAAAAATRRRLLNA